MIDQSRIMKTIPRIESELLVNILPFWMNHTIDKENGGFYGEISNNLVVNPLASKGALLTSRILWTFSAAYRRYQKPAYLTMANYAYHSLMDDFWDDKYGGLYWEIHADGTPLRPRKHIYGQAFGIYALAEYYVASGHQQALDRAILIFQAIEKYSYDPVHGGYYEAFGRDWQADVDLKLSEVDMSVLKSQNTHLHILEAYTNLMRVWDNELLKKQQTSLIQIMMKKITNPLTCHLILFQDEDWTPKSEHVSYGHDIEASWLMLEAAEIVGNHQLIDEVKHRVVGMAQAVYDEGLDSDGAIFYESSPDGETDKRKSWWPQVEAAVGFLNAFQLSRSEYFLEAALKSWEFIEKSFVDRKYGGWFRFANHAHPELDSEPKVSFWKCPYHNSRACMELTTRLQLMLDEPV